MSGATQREETAPLNSFYQNEKEPPKSKEKAFSGNEERELGPNRPQLSYEFQVMLDEIRKHSGCGKNCIIKDEYREHVNKPFDAAKEIGSGNVEQGVVMSREAIKSTDDMKKITKNLAVKVIGGLLLVGSVSAFGMLLIGIKLGWIGAAR